MWQAPAGNYHMDIQQISEFSTNHPLLTGGFVAVLLFWVFTEFKRRFQGFSEVSSAQAVAMINRDGAVVVDVSSQSDYNKGHIADAIHLPASRLNNPDDTVASLKGKQVLVVDKAGQTTAQAASRLLKLGAAQVATLKGGMAQWVNDQYPVTRS